MITKTLAENEETITLSSEEEYKVLSINSFSVAGNSIVWSSIDFSSTNKGELKAIGENVIFSSATDIYIKTANKSADAIVQFRKVAL